MLPLAPSMMLVLALFVLAPVPMQVPVQVLVPVAALVLPVPDLGEDGGATEAWRAGVVGAPWERVCRRCPNSSRFLRHSMNCGEPCRPLGSHAGGPPTDRLPDGYSSPGAHNEGRSR